MYIILPVWAKLSVLIFSYNKCNLNTNLPAVPRFRIDYFCLNKDSAISLHVFLQLAIKLVADCKSWFCRRQIQQIFEANIAHIFNVHFFKYTYLSCSAVEELIFFKAGKKHKEVKFLADCNSTFGSSYKKFYDIYFKLIFHSN